MQINSLRTIQKELPLSRKNLYLRLYKTTIGDIPIENKEVKIFNKENRQPLRPLNFYLAIFVALLSQAGYFSLRYIYKLDYKKINWHCSPHCRKLLRHHGHCLGCRHSKHHRIDVQLPLHE